MRLVTVQRWWRRRWVSMTRLFFGFSMTSRRKFTFTPLGPICGNDTVNRDYCLKTDFQNVCPGKVWGEPVPGATVSLFNSSMLSMTLSDQTPLRVPLILRFSTYLHVRLKQYDIMWLMFSIQRVLQWIRRWFYPQSSILCSLNLIFLVCWHQPGSVRRFWLAC